MLLFCLLRTSGVISFVSAPIVNKFVDNVTIAVVVVRVPGLVKDPTKAKRFVRLTRRVFRTVAGVG